MDFLKLIQEGRVDDFKAKYSQKFGTENINKIIKAVPQKYLDWVGRHMDMVNFDENLTKLETALNAFQKISSNLPITDLYQYKNMGQLFSALADYGKRQRRVVKKVEGGNVVYDDGRYFVVNPLTHDSSCYYGKGTKWCTTASTDHQFKRYNEDGKLFYILDRQAPSDNKFYKVALLRKFDGDKTYYDALDHTFNNGWIIGSNKLNEILGAVDGYIDDQYPEQVKIFKDKELARQERERLERARLAAILRQREEGAQVRRANNEWELGPGCPEEGLKAHALLEFLSDNNDVEILTNLDRGEIARIETEIDRLQAEYDADEEARVDLMDQIEELQDELDELRQKVDVYNMIPTGEYYNTTEFEVIGVPDLEDQRYAVGDEDEMHSSSVEYLEQLLDDVGYEGFNQSFVRDYIDEEEVIDYAREFYEQDIYENPEIYIDESQRELSRKQVEEIKVKNDKIRKLSEYILKLQDQMDGEDDDEIQEKIDEIQETIDELEEEVSEIESEPDGDFPDDLIEDAIESQLSGVKYDVQGFMSEWGLNYNDYINRDKFIEAIIDADGYGHTLNGYDGSADEYRVQDELFYVMRID